MKHPTPHTLHSFSKKEICKSLKKKYSKHRRTASCSAKERRSSFTRKKATSDLFGNRLFITQDKQVVDLDKQIRRSEDSDIRKLCLRRGFFLPKHYSEDDEMCMSFGVGLSKYFIKVPVSHQAIFSKYFYLSARTVLLGDPLSALILPRLLRLDRGFLMSYFLIIDRNNFRNWTTICKAFDDIKPVKLRIYTISDYYRIFSTSNNDPITGLTKYDLVYILLKILAEQHDDIEPLTVSRDYPSVIEYFSLYRQVDYIRATKTTE